MTSTHEAFRANSPLFGSMVAPVAAVLSRADLERQNSDLRAEVDCLQRQLADARARCREAELDAEAARQIAETATRETARMRQELAAVHAERAERYEVYEDGRA